MMEIGKKWRDDLFVKSFFNNINLVSLWPLDWLSGWYRLQYFWSFSQLSLGPRYIWAGKVRIPRILLTDFSTCTIIHYSNGRSMLTERSIFTSLCHKEVPSYLYAHSFSKSLHSMIVRNSTSQVIESTDSPTLFANDQGSEIPDSSHFYKIFRTFYSTESDAVTSANYDAVNSANYDAATATFAPFVIANDSTWNDDTTITLYNISNKTSKTIDDRRNVNGEIIIL